jgi:hypothetical protein
VCGVKLHPLTWRARFTRLYVMLNSCPVGSSADTSECRACDLAPKGAIFLQAGDLSVPCDWQCGPGYFKDEGNTVGAICTACTSKCPTGKYLAGSCLMGALSDGHHCDSCGPLPPHSTYMESSEASRKEQRDMKPGRAVIQNQHSNQEGG